METQKTAEHYIEEIAKLPEPLSFLLESENEQWVFNKCRETNKILALWLRRKILHQPLNPLALQNNGHALIPQADFLKAMLDLCQEITLRVGCPIDHVALWFYFIKLKANNAVDFFGLTGNPALMGKRKMTENLAKVVSQFENLSVDYKDVKFLNNLELNLYYIGQEIAKKDPYFDTHYWTPFIKRWKHYVRHFQKSDHLHLAYLLPNNQIKMTKGGKGRMPKKAR